MTHWDRLTMTGLIVIISNDVSGSNRLIKQKSKVLLYWVGRLHQRLRRYTMLYFYVFFVCHCSILYLGVLTDDYGLSKSSKKYITNPTKKIPTTHFSYFERWKYVLTTYVYIQHNLCDDFNFTVGVVVASF